MIGNADQAGDSAHDQQHEQADKNAQRSVDDVQNAKDLHVLRHIHLSLRPILPTLVYESGVGKFRKKAFRETTWKSVFECTVPNF
jgi:hypothetical protein